jgi:hypothetical protein
MVAQGESAGITLSAEALEGMLSRVLEEAKKPYVDPDVAAKIQRARERVRQANADMVAAEKATQANCTHLREDTTSAIAWMLNSDDVWRGVCMHCRKLYTPEDTDYTRVIRIPTRTARSF